MRVRKHFLDNYSSLKRLRSTNRINVIEHFIRLTQVRLKSSLDKAHFHGRETLALLSEISVGSFESDLDILVLVTSKIFKFVSTSKLIIDRFASKVFDSI